MIDNITLTELVQQEVKKSVTQYVETKLQDVDWQKGLEQQIVKYVQTRVMGSFSSLTDVPGITDLVKQQVTVLFDQGQIPAIDQYVDTDQIKQAVDSATQMFVQRSIDSLVLDQTWISKIEQQANQRMTSRLIERISAVDINQLISNEIDHGITRWQSKLLKDFQTNGIRDSATQCELTVMDNAVVAANGLAAKNMLIEETAEIKGGLLVKNLAVTGTINTDNRAWKDLADTVSNDTLKKLTKDWQAQLVQEVLAAAKTQGIDFANITVNQTPLVTGAALSKTITESNLQTLGNLKKLSVIGDNQPGSAVLSACNRRVGINTAEPEMALGLWDEEVSVLVGKLSADTAFVGTGRKQNLAIGVNRKAVITVDHDGLVTVPRLRVDRWQVSYNDTVPGWSGTRGDFVFNSAAKVDDAFAWICLGGYRWQPLKSA